jgi:hypothetical protein
LTDGSFGLQKACQPYAWCGPDCLSIHYATSPANIKPQNGPILVGVRRLAFHKASVYTSVHRTIAAAWAVQADTAFVWAETLQTVAFCDIFDMYDASAVGA